ncbi:MAG: acyl-CoA desaturase [Myxococcaceae bacterium]|nr:acyl-CoA desaturase [Myxococcaceae bacterium]
MVYAFFFSHWVLSVFFQSLFHHRYGAHRMYTMGPRTERVLHFLTYLVQGASYLNPRGYAILHREHHAFSDTEKDPHSPHFFRNAFRMMLDTKHRYDDYSYDRKQPEARFLGGYPEWKLVDRTLGQSWVMRLVWVGLYTAFYVAFATAWWQFLLLPIHFLMGPVHGAIVNWCGHKYGYQNFDNGDKSRNTLPFDVLCMGELFQNNHHKWGMSPNFAARRWELDPTWQVMKVLAWLKVIHIATPQRAVWPEPHTEPTVARAA